MCKRYKNVWLTIGFSAHRLGSCALWKKRKRNGNNNNKNRSHLILIFFHLEEKNLHIIFYIPLFVLLVFGIKFSFPSFLSLHFVDYFLIKERKITCCVVSCIFYNFLNYVLLFSIIFIFILRLHILYYYKELQYTVLNFEVEGQLILILVVFNMNKFKQLIKNANFYNNKSFKQWFVFSCTSFSVCSPPLGGSFSFRSTAEPLTSISTGVNCKYHNISILLPQYLIIKITH